MGNMMKRRSIGTAEFELFASPLVGLPVSHIWEGYGSAIFLELGVLTPSIRRRRDGSFGNLHGEWTLTPYYGWRIEGKRRIWCGSSSDKDRWLRIFSRLEGRRVISVAVSGRLPEIDVGLANGLHIVSCMTTEGDPDWGLSKRSGRTVTSVGVQAGRLMMEVAEERERRSQSET